MAREFLSQDEVDALLRGVTGETDDERPAEDARGVRPYNLATQERIVRGRMPTLEIINERFAKNIRAGLFGFIRKSPEVSIGPMHVHKFSAFLREIDGVQAIGHGGSSNGQFAELLIVPERNFAVVSIA